MRIDRYFLPALLLMCLPALGQDNQPATQPRVDQTQTSSVPGGGQEKNKENNKENNKERKKEAEKAGVPARFIPKEKIPSDSVISFPADI